MSNTDTKSPSKENKQFGRMCFTFLKRAISKVRVMGSNTQPEQEIERDIEHWMCEDCFRRLHDGPYESCPDCDCENVVPMRKWVVIRRDTMRSDADSLNPLLAWNETGDGEVIQIHDADTGEQVWDIDEGWVDDE